ncbi:hypothetical protein [Cohnella nanjingensis]|uniref:Thioredoxin domain-containing protein n=1 Tax=Cohnella nanjingensis TaxID=1387779 RepID=A0A7X0RN10_9BACL|nr:hypothetical protein [Cohnella nanjingensis]MBB6670529.1 hypothetical protein [Cohnella nanjingensis]
MKKIFYISLIAVAAFLIVAGCSSSRKNDTSNEFFSKESGTYAGYLFWNLDSDVNELNKELLSIVNSNQVMQSIRFSKVEIISMNDKNRVDDVKELGIQKSPTLIIFDTDKLVLQTSDLKELYNLADQLKGEKG